MSYVIGTGFFHKIGDAQKAREFFRIWYANTYRHAQPEDVFVIENGGCSSLRNLPGQQIHLTGNLGHAHEVNTGKKPHAMCGWSAIFVTLAMLAYNDEQDYVFKEQDCLAFGPWVDRMYSEIGSAGMIFGSNQFPCAQSLVLIKHAFIPEFVKLYMQEGTEQIKGNECEHKFARMERAHPDLFKRFSFGVDRARPIPYEADVFYAQQIKPEEMDELKRRGLI